MTMQTTRESILRSWCLYAADPAAFVRECGYLYDAAGEGWVRFDLWPAQGKTLRTMAASKKLVILKARQLGITWLCLGYALWLMLFRAPATVLLFSLREEEAKELLWRLRGMYDRLPPHLQARAVTGSNETRWMLSNGSRALAFSTRSGRSYTGTLALVDEADFVPDLAQFLNAVKPTIDGGGQLFLVSTSDKRRPQSTFKRLFRAAGEGKASRKTPLFQEDPTLPGSPPAAGDYRRVFLPWSARPGRNERWRAAVQAEMFAQRGTHDDFYAEYPATAEEALAAEQLDRRLPWDWVKRCQRISTSGLSGADSGFERGLNGADSGLERGLSGADSGFERGLNGADSGFERGLNGADSGLERGLSGVDSGLERGLSGLPGVPGLRVWEGPVCGRRYVIGADPAEGNPNSDESAACVLDGETWAQVAELAGRIEPSVFASYIDQLGRWYNGAEVMVERNNHGHLVIRELLHLGHLRPLEGYDGKVGWLSNIKGKPLLYGLTADAVREGACTIRGSETAAQLASIEASTLHAPAGLHDDRADAFALAIAALAWKGAAGASTVIAQRDPLAEYDGGSW